MNVAKLLNRYFQNSSSLPTIEVFDNENIYDVYVDIVNTLKASPEIEIGVLQLLSYCFYEILDNVLTHSGKKSGTVLMHYEPTRNSVKILVADDGIGIRESLSQNQTYAGITEPEAVQLCVQDRVTDGQGYGIWIIFYNVPH